MEEFTPEQQKLLSPFFTNIDKPIFVLKNLPEVVKGALFSRYSRTDKSLRRVLMDEFINIPEAGFKEIVGFQVAQGEDQIVATKKAEEFYDRVLVGYGDDSVAELAGAHIAVEQVSNLATKVMEDARIGLSPLEKSSRYVWFNNKTDGQYRFYRGNDVISTNFVDDYLMVCNLLFDTYSNLVEPMQKFYIEKFPQTADTPERAYKFTIRAKACDTIRGLLPAATLTNMGMFGNGRSFEYLITKMNAHSMPEMKSIASMMHGELSKVIPSFVKRAHPQDRYGAPTISYMSKTYGDVKKLSNTYVPKGGTPNYETVSLIDYDKDAESKVISAMMYQHSELPLSELRKIVGFMNEKERATVINEHMKHRKNRRHKPPRAFENAYYTFDILGNYGIYRDLQRHRILTQERQLLTTRHGYDIPIQLIEAGFEQDFRDAMNTASEVFEKIQQTAPLQAQYVVPLAYKMRWYMKMNLRELYHFAELRSGQQGHPDYRRVAQQMYLKVKQIHPSLVDFMKFIDMNDYDLERLEAEKKLEKKMDMLRQKMDK